ncbi:MAG: hypothetical protein ACKOTZ_01230 [Chloroflexota bacterium]
MFPRRSRQTMLRVAIAGAIVVVIAPGQPAEAGGAVVRTYPSAACAGTLQACIDGAPAGARIEIRRTTRIDESLAIGRSITITGAPGVTPRIGSADPTDPQTVTIADDAGGPVRVTLAGLQLSSARVRVQLMTHAGSEVTLRDLVVRSAPDSNNTAGVGIDVRRGDSLVVLTRSDIRSTGQPVATTMILPDAESARVSIVGNRLAADDVPNGSHGIDIDLRGAGSPVVTVYGNTVRGAMGCDCGGTGAIAVSTSAAPFGKVQIVGNTIDRAVAPAGTGITVRTTATGGQTRIGIANNAITANGGPALELPGLTDRLAIAIGVNNDHGNAEATDFGGYPPSVPQLSVPPSYARGPGGDYRLRVVSQLIDAGETCVVGGFGRTDGAGRFRVAGLAVDIGAFELGATAAGAGVVRLGSDGPDRVVGTRGRDILCGFGGADALNPGAGADVVDGGPADDTLTTRDGTIDLVRGGTGRDTCIVDGGGFDTRVSCP